MIKTIREYLAVPFAIIGTIFILITQLISGQEIKIHVKPYNDEE